MQLVWRDVSIGDGPPINTSLTSAETAELQRLAKDADVLEIGSAYGYSTCALALVAKSVTAVDPHTGHGSLYALEANLNAYGVSHKAMILADTSQSVLPMLNMGIISWKIAYGNCIVPKLFDLMWIDGDHAAETVEHDVRWAKHLLKADGYLACHDYDEATCPGVRQALDKIFGGPGELTDTLAVYSYAQVWAAIT